MEWGIRRLPGWGARGCPPPVGGRGMEEPAEVAGEALGARSELAAPPEMSQSLSGGG